VACFDAPVPSTLTLGRPVGQADRFEVHSVGGSGIDELWVPADDLTEFNRHIVGTIELTDEYRLR
jgi:hypothetical protein